MMASDPKVPNQNEEKSKIERPRNSEEFLAEAQPPLCNGGLAFWISDNLEHQRSSLGKYEERKRGVEDDRLLSNDAPRFGW